MKIAHQIAQKLDESGIRLKAEWEIGALYSTPEHLKRELATLWLNSVGHDVEVKVSGIAVKTLGAQAAWFEAVFDDMQGGELLGEVDSELWAIQQQDIREHAA